jgi:hypothetical protein
LSTIHLTIVNLKLGLGNLEFKRLGIQEHKLGVRHAPVRG